MSQTNRRSVRRTLDVIDGEAKDKGWHRTYHPEHGVQWICPECKKGSVSEG